MQNIVKKQAYKWRPANHLRGCWACPGRCSAGKSPTGVNTGLPLAGVSAGHAFARTRLKTSAIWAARSVQGHWKSCKWTGSFRFPHQIPACISLFPHTCHIRYPSALPWFDRPTNEQDINLFGDGIIFLILAHPVYKMWKIQEPNMLELWNKLHF